MLLLLTACGGNSKDSDVLLNVTEGDTFEITLEAHGGTAYVWDYRIAPNSGIDYVKMEFVPTNSDPEIIGGGTLVYQFKAVTVGDYDIRFQCQIPHTNSLLETKQYKITVVK